MNKKEKIMCKNVFKNKEINIEEFNRLYIELITLKKMKKIKYKS